MKKIFLLTIFFASQIIPQSGKLIFLPDGLNILPFKANMQEARLGILYFPDNANLKVDIGNAVDILGYNFDDDKFAMGIEFMAYALSTNYQGRRLQIDALDGFFGGNASLSIPCENGNLLFRFRIIHNSAHFVDGHYDFKNDRWSKNIYPIPFTQDFGEITSAYHTNFEMHEFKYYGSIGYSSLVRPSLIKKWWANIGWEFYFKVTDNFFEKPVNVFVANQIKLVGMPKYKLNYNNMLGIKLGEVEAKGVVFYFDYYLGNNYFSEYYYNRIKKFGIGFFVDFL